MHEVPVNGHSPLNSHLVRFAEPAAKGNDCRHKVNPDQTSKDAPARVRKVARFSISLNLELLFCEIFYSKE